MEGGGGGWVGGAIDERTLIISSKIDATVSKS